MCDDQEEDGTRDDQEGQEASAKGSGNTTTALATANLSRSITILLCTSIVTNKKQHIVLDTTPAPAPAPAHPLSTGILMIYSYKIYCFRYYHEESPSSSTSGSL